MASSPPPPPSPPSPFPSHSILPCHSHTSILIYHLFSLTPTYCCSVCSLSHTTTILTLPHTSLLSSLCTPPFPRHAPPFSPHAHHHSLLPIHSTILSPHTTILSSHHHQFNSLLSLPFDEKKVGRPTSSPLVWARCLLIHYSYRFLSKLHNTKTSTN